MPALSAIGSIASAEAIGVITIVIALATTAQANQTHTDGTPPDASTTASTTTVTRTCVNADTLNMWRVPNRSMRWLLNSNAPAIPTPDNPKNTTN